THAETGPGERLPVGTALRKADEWGPGRRALDAHVLAVDVHEPGASAVALEHEFQGCLRRQAVLQLPLEAGDLRAQVRDSLAQAVRDVLSQEGRRPEGRRTLSHWPPRAEPGARRARGPAAGRCKCGKRRRSRGRRESTRAAPVPTVLPS